MRQGLFGPLLGQFESQFGFLLRQPFWAGWGAWLSVWSPGYRDKVGGQEGAEGFIPKSIPLGHRSGMSRKEKKGNTYATFTHFPGFLQNQSSYCSPSSSGYCGHALSHRKIRHVFKLWGSNLSQFFRVQFKGVMLELLAPICKRGKKKQLVPSFYCRHPSLL